MQHASTPLSISPPCWVEDENLLLLVVAALLFAGDKINLASVTKRASQILRQHAEDVLLSPSEAANQLGVQLKWTRIRVRGITETVQLCASELNATRYYADALWV